MIDKKQNELLLQQFEKRINKKEIKFPLKKIFKKKINKIKFPKGKNNNSEDFNNESS